MESVSLALFIHLFELFEAFESKMQCNLVQHFRKLQLHEDKRSQL